MREYIWDIIFFRSVISVLICMISLKPNYVIVARLATQNQTVNIFFL